VFSPRFVLRFVPFAHSLDSDEFRGAWIASVHNINFPSSEGLSADAQKAQIVRLLDAAKRCRHALMLEVRPESDALYPSRLQVKDGSFRDLPLTTGFSDSLRGVVRFPGSVRLRAGVGS
jgi:uncharacterized lipoprotein YddW (UPF0748 family)